MASLSLCAHRCPKSAAKASCRLLSFVLAFVVFSLVVGTKAHAVSKDSPEVLELVERGLSYLEKANSETRLGGRCLIALAFYKGKRPKDHPKILAALKACQEEAAKNPRTDSTYDIGLAIIFLCEIDAVKHKSLIEKFAGALANRQKKHGGWGYDHYETGDTSQTQYAVLSYWEMVQMGFSPSVKMIDECANWLMRTQDPSGVWGYQGKDPGSFTLIEQEETNSSMLLAGLGSTMMSGHIIGKLTTAQQQQAKQEETPSVLKRVETKKKKKVMRSLTGSSIDGSRLMQTIERGREWYDKEFKYVEGKYPYYELYSLERYKSFEELLTGNAPEEPEWYNKGYNILKDKISKQGSWRDFSGEECATAFSLLFLLRSTQASIQASLGEGTLIGSRGLSADLSRMKLKNGRLVAEAKPTEVDKLLGMLEGDGSDDLDALLKSPASLKMDNVSPKEARRLQQIVKSGNPASRILAVRALSRMRNLDHVPTLLYAMTDPDNRVVREARDGLRLVSRRFNGFGLDDNFEDADRFAVIEQWKQWYRRVRPNAPPLP